MSGARIHREGTPQMLMNADSLMEYLGVKDDTLRRFIAEGLPVYWTGGGEGCGLRLFHRQLVDDWFKARMEAEARRRAAEAAKGEASSPPRPVGRPAGAKGGGRRGRHHVN